MSDKTRKKQGDPTEPTAAPLHGHTATRRDILVGTALAAGAALVVLVVAVLPAEYGIDPTGIGHLTGIARLHAEDGAAGNATAIQHRAHDAAYRTDTVNVTVRPGDGVEYKLHLQEGDAMLYTWTAQQPLFFDFHGEPDAGPAGAFESYQKATQSGANGAFQAGFTGRHGWYWQNDGTQPVTVTLRTSGYYDVVGLV